MAAAEIPITSHMVGTGVQELRNLRLWQETATPADPTEGIFWYNSNVGNKRIQFYDGTSAVSVPRLDRDEVVTGQYGFTPGSAQAPFTLGANAQGQKVTGLNADLLDGYNADQAVTADTVAVRYTDGRLRVADPSVTTDAVNLQYLDAEIAALEIDADQITSGILALARGGTATDLSGAAQGALFYMGATGIFATTQLTGVLIGNGSSSPSALTELTLALGGTGGNTAAEARTNLEVLSQVDTIGLASGRGLRGGIWMAGSGHKITGADDIPLGLEDFSVAFDVTLLNTGVVHTFFWSHSTGNNRFRVTIASNHASIIIVWVDNAGTAVSTSITLDTALVVGQQYSIVVTCDRDDVATAYINGTAAASTVDISAHSATDIGSGNASTYVVGYDANAVLYSCIVFNRLLSSTDASALSKSGRPGRADQWGELATTYESDFSAGADSWAGNGSTVTGNTDAIESVDNVLKITGDGATSAHYAVRSSTGRAYQYYRVQLDYYIPTANTEAERVIVGAATLNVGTTAFDASTKGAWTTVSGVVLQVQGSQNLFVGLASTSAFSFATSESIYIKNVTVTPVGSIIDLDLENANPATSLVVKDRSTNSYDGTLASSSVSQVVVSPQLNAETLALSGYTQNQVLYIGASNAVTGITLHTGSSPGFLTQTSSGAPAFLDLYAASPTWTGAHTFSGTIVVPTPTLDTHAATKAYVDSAVTSGLRVLEECVVATTTNITLSGEQTIDGVLTSADRVLVKNQTDAEDNGIYVSAAGAWSRATDADAAAEITAGAYTFVSSGTVGAGTSWVQQETVTTLGTDVISWQKFFQQAAYTGGTGIDITGLTISVDLTASLDWTGAHTFTSSSGITLEPHGTSAGNTTELRFRELAANGTNYVGLKANDNIAANLVWTLPNEDGAADYYLTTNGVGGLSFVEIQSGHITNVDFVETLTGTADRITIGGTTVSPTIDIASTYVGQATITTLGTVTTGTWNATAIGTIYGGTGLTSYTTGDLLYASASNTLAKRTIGTAGKILQSLSGVPNWSAYTMPTSVAVNQLLYGSAANVVSALATSASKVLVTDGSGNISWGSTLPTGLGVTGDANSKVPKIRMFDVGDGSATSITLTHNLATRDVVVQVYEAGDEYKTVAVATARATTNTVVLEFVEAPTLNQYRAAVISAI